MKIKVLDLFSGIGGFSLGLERAGMETVAFCEIEEYPRKILKKHWPDVPIYEDVRKLDGRQYRGTVELICGGFPCQPFSVAGKQGGKEDDRHLWPEMLRLIREVKPTLVIGENVAGFITMALDDVLFDLESEGYTCQAFVIPACAVGGIHGRDRVWIVAYSNNSKAKRFKRNSSEILSEQKTNGCNQIYFRENVADSDSDRLQGCANKGSDRKANDGEQQRGKVAGRDNEKFRPIELPTESPVRHRNDGVPDNVARLKALGNAVVPQIPEMIGRAIMESIND